MLCDCGTAHMSEPSQQKAIITDYQGQITIKALSTLSLIIYGVWDWVSCFDLGQTSQTEVTDNQLPREANGTSV